LENIKIPKNCRDYLLPFRSSEEAGIVVYTFMDMNGIGGRAWAKLLVNSKTNRVVKYDAMGYTYLTNEE